MKISIVINTYNRMFSLPNTLNSLLYLRYPDLEVVVVDGPSNDGTLSYLKANWSEKIKICKCDAANLSKSRNIGIENASGDIICFTDDDGVPEPDWLDKLVLAYKDKNVGAAGGWVRNHTGVDYQTKIIISSRESSSEVLIDDPELVPECKAYEDKFPGLIGVNSSFRRKALIEIGGFDEEYAYFLDETDVLARLVDANYLIKNVPEAEVHHKYAPSHIRSQSGIAKSWLQIITSTAYYIIKNAPPQKSLVKCIEEIANQKQALKGHTNWFLSEKLIDEQRYQELIAEIDSGADKGISDAFKYPRRQLIKKHELTRWKPFPRTLDAGERLKLAFLTQMYPPRKCGGVAVFIYNLAKELAKVGHEITVITYSEEADLYTVDFEEGIWVHRLPQNDILAAEIPDNMPDMPDSVKNMTGKMLSELNRVNDKRNFDCVVGSIWDLDLAAVIASKKYKTAMYLVTSYKLMEESKPEWKENLHYYQNHVCKMIESERWAIRNTDIILASTKAILRDIEESYEIKVNPQKVKLVPFGVPSTTTLANRNNVSNKACMNLLFVGRCEIRKGIDLILEILPDLICTYPKLTFTCIGETEIAILGGLTYKQMFLEKYGEEEWINRVEFLGHVDDKKLVDSYANCDIFLAPSRYESFGLIYLEAMRFGKACIGCSVGGVPEIITDSVDGLLVPPGDSVALKQAIDKLICDDDLRKSLGEKALANYKANYTTKIFSEKFENTIRENVC